MNLSIRPPTEATDMDTHLHRYKRFFSNQESFLAGLKIATDKQYYHMSILIPTKIMKTS